MKLVTRVVAVTAVAALTFGTPTAAFAGGKNGPAKGKAAAAAQKHKASKGKAADARKKAEERRKKNKKAEEARSRFTFPGTVIAVGDGTVTISRKVRGTTVNQQFVLGSGAELKRDGVRGAAPQVGDHAVAKGQKKDGALVVRKLNASAPEAEETAPAPVTAPDAGQNPPAPQPAAKAADGAFVI